MDADNNRIKYFGEITNAANMQYAYKWVIWNTATVGGFETTAAKACAKQAQSGGKTLNSVGSTSGGWTWCYTNAGSFQVNYTINPYYNPNATGETFYVSFETIAQKIISNASSSNQAISLLAEAYLEAVATSIFNTNPSKQFVQLSDLLSQFELNKTLRT
ncbi:hypothetical protein [Acinetobacter bohemicus]|uniref:hypothetical protein n=1 Tax=Acinetobacter bohemicus TaxID=1435036 RepID=UPI003FA30BE0